MPDACTMNGSATATPTAVCSTVRNVRFVESFIGLSYLT
jgi:hypothetical protein